MKFKNILLLSISLLLFTGCTIKADITITDEKKVIEKIEIVIPNDTLDMYGYNTSDEFLDYYKSQYFTLPGYRGYDVKTKSKSDVSILNTKRTYSNLSDYVKSNSFLSLYTYATMEDTGRYLTFKTSNNVYLEMINNPIDMDHMDDREYEINIKFYNEVIEHNADKVDEVNNIYTWYIDKTTPLTDSFIYFKTGPKVKYFVKFKDYILNNLSSIIAIISIISVIGALIIYIVYKSKKNNEI